VSTTALRGPLASTDFTTKADADVLGNGWVDGHAWDPDVYEPLGVRDGAVVCTDPMARDVVYDLENQEGIGDGSVEGNLLGIGCAWRPTIYDAPTVTITWSGLLTPDHVEAAPCVHFAPGTDEHCLGVWVSKFGAQPLLLLATIGNPPEDVAVLDYASFSHTEGTDRQIEIRSTGTAVTVWLDGTQVSLVGAGTTPVAVPTALRGSTLHGLAIDTHLVADPGDIPTLPAILDWSIE
jgi:hypothetical protein